MFSNFAFASPSMGTRSRLLLAVAVLVGLALVVLRAMPAAPASAASQGLPTQPFLPLGFAQRAADAAIKNCRQRGFPVSVSVLDRDGIVIVTAREDRATGATVDVAREKAYAAVGFQAPTSALQDAARTQPGFVAIPGFVILPGGLPIKSGDVVVAGIGVSGAPSGEIDAECAQVGINAISGEL